MIPVVKEDILSVLKDAETFLKSNEILRLKELSDHTIHNSSIFQDEDSITIAVLVYSLSKICERNGNTSRFAALVRHARSHLLKDELSRYKQVIKLFARAISDSDSRFSMYVQDVIDKAEIKKGSRLYYHGISLAQAANLLGISQWELMSYVGKTHIIDTYTPIGNVNDRINLARKLFLK